jgi:hypothetical protein
LCSGGDGLFWNEKEILAMFLIALGGASSVRHIIEAAAVAQLQRCNKKGQVGKSKHDGDF